jgi:hypothetical protein
MNKQIFQDIFLSSSIVIKELANEHNLQVEDIIGIYKRVSPIAALLREISTAAEQRAV